MAGPTLAKAGHAGQQVAGAADIAIGLVLIDQPDIDRSFDAPGSQQNQSCLNRLCAGAANSDQDVLHYLFPVRSP